MHVLLQRKKNELKSWGCNTRGIGRPGSDYHKQHEQQGKIKQKEESQIAKKYIGIRSVIMCVQYSSSVLREIFIDKNSKSFNCCKVFRRYVDTFFAFCKTNGKNSSCLFWRDLVFRFFLLDPCFFINSFLFYAHWIIHVQMYWCQNVIFLKMLVFDDILNETA